MTTQSKTDRETIAENIVKFARENKLEIHPGQEPLKWADLVLKKGGCPCVPGRSECPCPFVLEDVKELNRCRCGLFVNGAYIREYNTLISQQKGKRRWTRKAKGEFLKKLSINGFAIEEIGNRLILRPRGAEATAVITIEEVKPDTWIVMSAAGRYAAFGRGRKRLIFENYIKQWVLESILRATGESFSLPAAPG